MIETNSKYLKELKNSKYFNVLKKKGANQHEIEEIVSWSKQDC